MFLLLLQLIIEHRYSCNITPFLTEIRYDIQSEEKTVDTDQLASLQPAGLDIHSF